MDPLFFVSFQSLFQSFDLPKSLFKKINMFLADLFGKKNHVGGFAVCGHSLRSDTPQCHWTRVLDLGAAGVWVAGSEDVWVFFLRCIFIPP